MAQYSQDRRTSVIQILAMPFTLRFLRGQGSNLRKHGIDWKVVCSPSKELEEFAAEERIQCIAIPIKRHISPLADMISLLRLIRLFRHERPDVIHSHTPKAGLLGSIAGAIARVPKRVYTIHGLVYETSSGVQRKLLMTTEKISCLLSTDVVSVSDSIRQLAIEDRLIDAANIVVLGSGSNNGIDAEERFNPKLYCRAQLRAGMELNPSSPVCVYIGRLATDKGLAELSVAWRTIVKKHPDATLIVAGTQDTRDPSDPSVIESLLATPGVRFMGHVENVPELLACSDVLVLPSYREGLGLVLLEASAMGLPVVASDIAGCKDAVVHGVTGTLVPVRQADSLARAVNQYFEDPALSKRHGSAGRERVLRDFRPETMAQLLSTIYRT